MSNLSQYPDKLPAPTTTERLRVLELLEEASRKRDVADIRGRFDVELINEAWKGLEPVQRSALLLTRAFDGEIIHDFDDSPPEWDSGPTPPEPGANRAQMVADLDVLLDWAASRSRDRTSGQGNLFDLLKGPRPQEVT
jgi:hypothetical protein